MPCQRSCCRAPTPTAVGPSPPAIVTPHQAHELAWRRLDARRRGSVWLQARDGGQSSPPPPPRRAAEYNGKDGGPSVGPWAPLIRSIGVRRPRLIRSVATGVFLFRHLFALLGGERLPTMARARPRLFRCSRTHSCPRRALDASCSTASCYRRRDRQDITQAQNLHAWARRRC